MKVFYTPKMVALEGGFSHSPQKPALAVGAWLEAGIPLDIEEPMPVTAEEFSLAHDRRHVEGILSFREKNGFGNLDPVIAASLPYTTGSMLSAARWAIAHTSSAAAPCSGFHHAR
jgi:acetoin utilization deacetylase AcuC-like enzyme